MVHQNRIKVLIIIKTFFADLLLSQGNFIPRQKTRIFWEFTITIYCRIFLILEQIEIFDFALVFLTITKKI